MDPQDLRADIPALEGTVYLNTGASGPSPRRVVAAAADALEDSEFRAHADEGAYPALFDRLDETRAAVANHLGTAPEHVALTQSTTDGINRIAAAMELSAGDVVVRTDLEHSAGILPWRRLREERDVEVRVVETQDGRVDEDAFAAAVEDAALAVFSSLTWTHGTRLPVEELTETARDAGARVIVDAVQSVGQHPVDVEAWGVDAVVGAGHKWLLGPLGAGFAYVEPSFARSLSPSAVGYMSVDDEYADPVDFHPDARRFEVSTVPVGPYAGMAEGVAIVEELGYDTITSRVERLTDRLKDGLGEDRLLSPREHESGLVTFEADDPDATVERLADAGVQVRAIPTVDAVRASVHAFNDESDVDALLDAL